MKNSEQSLDIALSRFLREGAERCERCQRSRHVVQLQCSHFYTRTARSVRFDPENIDILCSGCHRYFEERKNHEYLEWKKARLGTRRLLKLRRRYVTMKQWKPKDRAEMLDHIKRKDYITWYANHHH